MSIKNQAAKGVMWNAIERFSSQGIQFVLTIVIARLLSPDDYGLIAMLGIFMAIAQTMVDSGFCNALIQKKNRTELDYNTMFYFNIAAAVFIYLLLFVSAPFIADFYNQPALVKVTRVFGLGLITSSLGTIQMTRLMIALDFKKLAIATLLSVVVGGSIGVWMACHGYGVWTLVFQNLIGNLTWTVILWHSARWRPAWEFSLTSFRSLFSFGSRLLFSNLLHTLYTNMYSLVVGKCFNAATLGFFNRAYTLGQFPVQNFGNVVQKVLYPIQCRYQDNDDKFNEIFITYLRVSGFLLFPLMIGLAVLSTPVIQLLLTEKWLSAASFLQVLSLAFMWLPIMQANVSVLDAKGRSDYHMQSEIIKKILAVLILFSTIPFGIKAVCWGVLVYSAVDMIVIVAYSRRLTGIGYKAQIRILAPSMLLAICMGGIVYMVASLVSSVAAKLVLGLICGVAFYVLTTWLLKFQEYKLLRSFLRKDSGY
ncbi:lipopolysaccharide biosynthesis protein [Bacteroides sp. GD17]|jgi:teichuronic acid exporter|uniref:lipopolysaccharide biosynthesis protein n=1 Tax=Bacteroides sp. GD17 TaxID=3139826 RepID=UPI0025D08EB4|nr:lipopolysaccharide biosynthesis protein [uncultured Bacteroides sp.]